MGLPGKVALAVLAVIFLMSFVFYRFIPYDPAVIDLNSLREPPSLEHPFGTDSKGRDILARILQGGRISLSVSFVAAALSMLIGLTAGLVSGFYGGKIDMLFSAAVDLVLSFPALLLAIGVSILFPPGMLSVMLAISAVSWASFARLIRGYVLKLRSEAFIEAARAVGCSDGRIIFIHLLPQCIPLALVMTGLKLSGFILTEAALSFLGLGAQPPMATWGSMISAHRAFLRSAPWMVMFPGLMIAVTAVCFNIVADDLREKYEMTSVSGKII